MPSITGITSLMITLSPTLMSVFLIETMAKLNAGDSSSLDLKAFEDACFSALNDDLNTPILLAKLFEGVKWINLIKEGKESLSEKDLEGFRKLISLLTSDVLGLTFEEKSGGNDELTPKLIQTLLDIRKEAKQNKDWATSDKIRNTLTGLGVVIKDTKEGAEWTIE